MSSWCAFENGFSKDLLVVFGHGVRQVIVVVSGVRDVVMIFRCILYVLGDWREGVLAALLV